jgi:hypothetical protein
MPLILLFHKPHLDQEGVYLYPLAFLYNSTSWNYPHWPTQIPEIYHVCIESPEIVPQSHGGWQVTVNEKKQGYCMGTVWTEFPLPPQNVL